STTAFVHFVGGLESRYPQPPHCMAERVLDWQVIDGNALPTDAVRSYMTSDPVTADLNTPVHLLAKRMLDAHIHRIVVVDAEGHPTGVVSSTDILAAVAYAELA